jgi:hypothetical protein
MLLDLKKFRTYAGDCEAQRRLQRLAQTKT